MPQVLSIPAILPIIAMYSGPPDVLSFSKALIPPAEGSVPGDNDSWAEDESDFSRSGREVGGWDGCSDLQNSN
jgi:hypothetical protein